MDFPGTDTLETVVDDITLPRFARVRYEPETPELDDVEGTVRTQLDELPLSDLEAGTIVAVGVGSRGIDRIALVAETVVDELAGRGFEPVVVPAMGSHGGATPEGQREALASYGVTEERLGCDIDARMETTTLGTADHGFAVEWSTAALDADASLVINRVKAHTNFQAVFESGLTKMAVIGLGKQAGAQTTHENALTTGYEAVLRDAFCVIRRESNLVGGVALVENFYDRLAAIEAIPAADLPDGEGPLLARADEYMPTLPYDELDVLVVDRMGKDISGAGMDTNVIGRYNVLNTDDPAEPDISRIYVRSLTEASHGNGAGIGLADLTRRKLVENLDLDQVYTNTLTSSSLQKAHLPVVLPNDDFAVREALTSVGTYDPTEIRVAWIRDTGHLDVFRISEALVGETDGALTVEGWDRLSFENGEAVFTPESGTD
ncbi:MAG TPA: lactate racemase domain-containing protein [Halococcus sp.]|nr:lactate racemase domain-containing protein [Halococcus sp.]